MGDCVSMDVTTSLAMRIVKMEVIEAEHSEAQARRESLERITAKFSSNTGAGKKAREGFREWTDKLIMFRKQLAQAIFDTYGKGIDANGKIVWRD